MGTGPGRFLSGLGGPSSRRLGIDLSVEMLRRARREVPAAELVRSDARRPALADRAFAEVALLGNAIGFAGADAERVLSAAEGLTAPGGHLLLEVAPGAGERSRYLTRLPPSAAARLIRSPTPLVLAKVDAEGFVESPPRRKETASFRRLSAERVGDALRDQGWTSLETLAAGPCLGADPERLDALCRDPKAWAHLLELEEAVGRRPERWGAAAAVLMAYAAPPRERGIK